MTQLKLSRDRKVAPYIQSPFGASPKPIANSFGLPAGTSCPGMTPFCKGCYAAAVEKRWSGPAKLVQHNWQLLQELGDDVERMAWLLLEAIDQYLVEHQKAEKRSGSAIPKAFRTHWDGDYYSHEYAQAWRWVMLARPEVEFWAYTRSFTPQLNVIPDLRGVPNLRLYLSVDRWNRQHVEAILEEDSWVHIASCDDSYESAQTTMVEITGRRAPKCPENARVVPLINAEGVGACMSCKMCTNFGPRRGDVLFSSTHK